MKITLDFTSKEVSVEKGASCTRETLHSCTDFEKFPLCS